MVNVYQAKGLGTVVDWYEIVSRRTTLSHRSQTGCQNEHLMFTKIWCISLAKLDRYRWWKVAESVGANPRFVESSGSNEEILRTLQCSWCICCGARTADEGQLPHSSEIATATVLDPW